MKRILVTLASLAVALAASFGFASAHPTDEPTPAAQTSLNNTPGVVLDDEADLDQEGDENDVEIDEPETADADGAAENKTGHDDGDDEDVDDESEHEDDD